METPGWPQAEVLAKAIGAKIVRVVRRESDKWHLPLDTLADAVTTNTKLIFLSNPNNPTGQLLDEAALQEVVSIADKVGAWLLVDEVYAGLEWNGPRAAVGRGALCTRDHHWLRFPKPWGCKACAPVG